MLHSVWMPKYQGLQYPLYCQNSMKNWLLCTNWF